LHVITTRRTYSYASMGCILLEFNCSLHSPMHVTH
jgi:hypothetical protein